MTTIPKDEQDDNHRLANHKQHLANCRERENEARASLNAAIDDTRRAKEKYEALFAECEERATARRKSGQVIVNPGY